MGQILLCSNNFSISFIDSNWFSNLFFSSVLLIFPFMFYFMYLILTPNAKKWEKDWIFTFALIFTITFFLKYGNSDFIGAINVFEIILLVLILNKRSYLLLVSFVGLFLLSFLSSDTYIGYTIFHLIYLSSMYLIYRTNKIKPLVFLFVNFLIIVIIFLMFNLLIAPYILHRVFVENLLELFFLLIFEFILAYVLHFILIQSEKYSKMYADLNFVSGDNQLYNNLAKITHEIKNPIAVVKGYIELMEANPKKSEKYIPVVKSEINRALHLMEDFLSISKIKIEKDLMDLHMLVEDVVATMYPLLTQHNIRANIKFNDEIYVIGDYMRLKQVLINIVKNAIEAIGATSKKSGTISFKVEQTKDHVTLSIIDTGEGMTDEDKQNIGTGMYTRKEKGAGIGILLSMEIIKLHQGKLIYESKRFVGTTVKITLPLTYESNDIN